MEPKSVYTRAPNLLVVEPGNGTTQPSPPRARAETGALIAHQIYRPPFSCILRYSPA